jgi:hypothetical protein
VSHSLSVDRIQKLTPVFCTLFVENCFGARAYCCEIVIHDPLVTAGEIEIDVGERTTNLRFSPPPLPHYTLPVAISLSPVCPITTHIQVPPMTWFQIEKLTLAPLVSAF